MSRIVLTQLILIAAISLLTLVSLYEIENGDIGVVIFGTILYLPFIILLALYNGLIIGLFEKWNKRTRIINYLLPTVPLVIWFLLSNGTITIRFWKIGTKEFSILLATLILTNLCGLYISKTVVGKTASR